MRKLTVLFSGSSLIAAAAFTIMSMAYSEGGRIKVYLENKCTKDVTIRIESPGSATTYTVEDGTSKPDTFLEGTKIFNSNGKLAHTVTTSSEGKTIIVCD